MSSQNEQRNTLIFKKVILLLFIITIQVAAGNDEHCPSETVYSRDDLTPVKWVETSVSSKLIVSDCLLDNRQLMQRLCESGGWKPGRELTESKCEYYQPPIEKYGNCPPHYIEAKIKDLCYHRITPEPLESLRDLCLTTAGSSLSFLDLNSNEQYSLLQEILTSSESNLNIGLPAKNMYPSKQISTEIDYTIEEVDMQWLLPGRYGSILKFSNNSASVFCRYKNLCVEMCLSINITQRSVDKPFTPVIEECSDISSVLCVAKKNSVVNKIGCSKDGYYHVTYGANGSLCYSIKFFDQPLSINTIESSETIIQNNCDGNDIFHMDTLESYIIYRQLAFVNALKNHERCLFGTSSLNRIIKSTDWIHDNINFTNWDKTMDFNAVNLLSNSFLTVQSDGRWRWEDSATCIVCTMDDPPPPSPVELRIQFNISDSILTLSVINQQYLWKEKGSLEGFLCFALIANNYIEAPVNRTIETDFYLLTNVGAGTYWCSGHVIRSFKFVESNKLYVFGMVFAIYVEYYCDDECGDPLDYTEMFKNIFDKLIHEDLMKIEYLQNVEHNIGDSDNKIRFMFHIMVSINEAISDDNEQDRLGLSKDQLNSYYVVKKLQNLYVKSVDSQFEILSVKSRDFCLPESITFPEAVNWKAAKLGETIEILESCYNFTRTCSRTGSNGAVWEELTIKFTCNNQSETTRSLIRLHNNFRSSEQTTEVISNLTTTLDNTTLTAGDMFVVSEIFEKISNFILVDQICLSYCELKNIFEIYNRLMSVSEEVAITSSQLNSTNSLLSSFDKILLYQAESLIIHHESFTDGVVSIKSPLLVNFVLDPVISGFSGIAFFNNAISTEEDFVNYSIKYLTPDQSTETLLEEMNLVVASFVPQRLIETLKAPKLIFTLFFNDILFQSSKKSKIGSDGIIISLTILNSHSNVSSLIPFFFKPNISILDHKNYRSAQICGYWSFTSQIGWESTGCFLNELSLKISNTILCECSHLTHFGNLINSKILSELNEKILNLITLTGCVLSLVGIIGIFVTAVVFRSWRSKSSSKFLLQLSAAIAIQISLMIFINSDDEILTSISGNVYGCIAMGALIHYSILVMFFWMLIVAYLQFIRYVIVFNQIATANFLLKSSIFGWGIPLLPVFLVVAIDPTSYIPSSDVKFCYPSGYGLLYGLLIPITLIVIANIFVFIAVIFSLVKDSSKSAACKYSNDKNDAMWSQLRLSVFLFFVLGLSWIFGFLSNGSILFSYLFCLTATMQGFVLFFYFVILDPVARNLWKQLFLKMCSDKRNLS